MTSNLGFIDAMFKALNGCNLELDGTWTQKHIDDAWRKFQLLGYKEMTGNDYSGGDIDRDFWKEWISYFGTAGTQTGNLIDDEKIGLKAFLTAIGDSINPDNLTDLNIRVWNNIIDLAYSIFLPAGYVFDSQRQETGSEWTVEYPVLDANYKPDGTWTDEDVRVPFNVYIGTDSEGEFKGKYDGTSTILYDLYNIETETWDNDKTPITSGDGFTIILLTGNVLTNLRIGGVRIGLFLDERFTITDIYNLFVPAESLDVDEYGKTLVDYTDITNEPMNAEIVFPELTLDVFNLDLVGNAYWKGDVLTTQLYDVTNPHRIPVNYLIRQELILSLMTGYTTTEGVTSRPAIFSYVKDGALKRLVAYSAITEANGENVLSAFKDTVTDFNPYALAFTYRSSKLDSGGALASDGEAVTKVLCLSCENPFIKNSTNPVPMLLSDGSLFFDGTINNMLILTTPIAFSDGKTLEFDITLDNVLATANYFVGLGNAKQGIRYLPTATPPNILIFDGNDFSKTVPYTAVSGFINLKIKRVGLIFTITIDGNSIGSVTFATNPNFVITSIGDRIWASDDLQFRGKIKNMKIY